MVKVEAWRERDYHAKANGMEHTRRVGPCIDRVVELDIVAVDMESEMLVIDHGLGVEAGERIPVRQTRPVSSRPIQPLPKYLDKGQRVEVWSRDEAKDDKDDESLEAKAVDSRDGGWYLAVIKGFNGPKRLYVMYFLDEADEEVEKTSVRFVNEERPFANTAEVLKLYPKLTVLEKPKSEKKFDVIESPYPTADLEEMMAEVMEQTVKEKPKTEAGDEGKLRTFCLEYSKKDADLTESIEAEKGSLKAILDKQQELESNLAKVKAEHHAKKLKIAQMLMKKGRNTAIHEILIKTYVVSECNLCKVAIDMDLAADENQNWKTLVCLQGGHILCGVCGQNQSVCPICQVPFKKEENDLAEIIDSVLSFEKMTSIPANIPPPHFPSPLLFPTPTGHSQNIHVIPFQQVSAHSTAADVLPQFLPQI